MKIGTFSYGVAKHKKAGSENSAGRFVGMDVSGLAESPLVRIDYPNGVAVSRLADLPLISLLTHLTLFPSLPLACQVALIVPINPVDIPAGNGL